MICSTAPPKPQQRFRGQNSSATRPADRFEHLMENDVDLASTENLEPRIDMPALSAPAAAFAQPPEGERRGEAGTPAATPGPEVDGKRPRNLGI